MTMKFVGGDTSLQRCNRRILQSNSTEQTTLIKTHDILFHPSSRRVQCFLLLASNHEAEIYLDLVCLHESSVSFRSMIASTS